MFKSDNWKSANEYANDFGEQLKKITLPEDKVEWDPDATSDHAPVTAYGQANGTGFWLLSWNMLNTCWIGYQEERVDTGQRLYDHWMVKKDNRETRLLHQYIFLKYTIFKAGNSCLTIFLQEVSPLMHEILKIAFGETFHIVSHFTNNKGNNLIVTMFPRRFFEFNYKHVSSSSALFSNFLDERTASVTHITHKASNEELIVVNVHLDFGTNKRFAEALLEESNAQNKCILVAGDFNASLRLPIAGECDNVTAVYGNSSRFRFFSDEPSFNHLNLFKNTVDKNVVGLENGRISRMYDRFGHFMLVYPSGNDDDNQ